MQLDGFYLTIAITVVLVPCWLVTPSEEKEATEA